MNTQNTAGKNLVMTLALLAVASTSLLAGVTQAAEPGNGLPKQAVAYSQLNLDNAAGAKVLFKRIQAAADQVCGKVDVRDLQGMSANEVCRQRAISEAVAAVNSPMLTRVSLAKSGNPQSLPLAQLR